jgi:hypothetical protein
MPNVANTAAIIRKKSLIGSSSNFLFNRQVITITSNITLIYIVAGVIKYFIVIIFFGVILIITDTTLGGSTRVFSYSIIR